MQFQQKRLGNSCLPRHLHNSIAHFPFILSRSRLTQSFFRHLTVVNRSLTSPSGRVPWRIPRDSSVLNLKPRINNTDSSRQIPPHICENRFAIASSTHTSAGHHIPNSPALNGSETGAPGCRPPARSAFSRLKKNCGENTHESAEEEK